MADVPDEIEEIPDNIQIEAKGRQKKRLIKQVQEAARPLTSRESRTGDIYIALEKFLDFMEMREEKAEELEERQEQLDQEKKKWNLD